MRSVIATNGSKNNGLVIVMLSYSRGGVSGGKDAYLLFTIYFNDTLNFIRSQAVKLKSSRHLALSAGGRSAPGPCGMEIPQLGQAGLYIHYTYIFSGNLAMFLAFKINK